MKQVWKDLFFTINMYEFETLLKLERKERVTAILGQTCLYVIFIMLIHLTFLPYYNRTPNSEFMIYLIYSLMFVGITGINFITLLSPSLYKFRKFLKYASFVVTILGSILLGYQISIILGDGIAYQMEESSIDRWLKNHIIFDSIPSTEAFVLLGVSYLMFLTGLKFSTHALNYINEAKIGVESEISAARKIQESINTPIDVTNNKYEAHGFVIPAKEVGGDYMEWFEESNGRKTLAVGDVSGHDTASGLLMGMSKAAFETELRYEPVPEKRLATLNNLVYKFSSQDKFITFLTLGFDFDNSRLITCNAGHLPLLLLRKGTDRIEEIKPSGILLGVVEDSQYSSEVVEFNSGDIFVAYTDGIVEARSRKDEEFGMDRLKDIIIQHSDSSSSEILSKIQEEYRGFCSINQIADDISIFVLKVK